MNNFWFKLNFREWLVSTSGMDANVKGWYIDLLCQQADKGSLPNDIETLAQLANVKYSEYETFKRCFKRTLEPKFEKQNDGTLINIKLQKVIHDNSKYMSDQSKRAIVGALVKKGREKYKNVLEQDWKKISSALMKINNLKDFSIEKKEHCLQHTLKEVIYYDFDSYSYFKNNSNFSKSINYEKIKLLYNSTCTNLNSVSRINKIRKEKINDIIQEHNPKDAEQFFLNVFKKVKESKFLNGGGQKGFVMTFDWMLKPENFLKILEDNYKDSKPQTDTSDDNR